MKNNPISPLLLMLFCSLTYGASVQEITPSEANKVLVNCRLFNSVYDKSPSTASGYNEITGIGPAGLLKHTSRFSANVDTYNQEFSFVWIGIYRQGSDIWNTWKIVSEQRDAKGSSGQPARCLADGLPSDNRAHLEACTGSYPDATYNPTLFIIPPQYDSNGKQGVQILSKAGEIRYDLGVLVADPFYDVRSVSGASWGQDNGIWFITGCQNKWGQVVSPTSFYNKIP